MPGRVGRLGDVGRAGVGLGVSVTVHHAVDLPTAIVNVHLGLEMVRGMNRVQLGGLGRVATRIKPGGVIAAGNPGDQPARFQRVLPKGQVTDRIESLAIESEHDRNHIGSLITAMGKTKKPGNSDPNSKHIASNRAARRNYSIDETLEAGVVLQGSEVKSMREAQVQLADAYARIRDGEAWLEGVHVAPYLFAVGVGAHEPDRPRKLLLHRDEIRRLKAKIDQDRVSIVPLNLYFKDGRVKVELGVGKGRNKGDKRQAMAERDSKREVDRELGRLRKGM